MKIDKRTAVKRLAVATCLNCLTIAGCGRMSPSKGGPIDAFHYAQRVLTAYDTSGDGSVSLDELRASPGWTAAFARADVSQDGKLSNEELAIAINTWHGSRNALVPTVCEVRSGGKPVANAVVRLTVEKTIADLFAAAEGTTDADGLATMSVGGDKPGVYPAIYTVEVTRADSSQPVVVGGYEARYGNGQSDLHPRFELK